MTAEIFKQRTSQHARGCEQKSWAGQFSIIVPTLAIGKGLSHFERGVLGAHLPVGND